MGRPMDGGADRGSKIDANLRIRFLSCFPAWSSCLRCQTKNGDQNATVPSPRLRRPRPLVKWGCGSGPPGLTVVQSRHGTMPAGRRDAACAHAPDAPPRLWLGALGGGSKFAAPVHTLLRCAEAASCGLLGDARLAVRS